MTRRTFGSLRRLPSGRWQARYTGPDLNEHKAPRTFDTKTDADAWLALERATIMRQEWTPPGATTSTPGHHGAGPVLFGDYFTGWLAARDLRPSTRAQYVTEHRAYLSHTWDHVPVTSITPLMVRTWYAEYHGGESARRHAYALLRTVLNTAVEDELIASNPCRVRGGGTSRRRKQIRPATLGELELIAAATPPRYQLMVLLAAWCGLRWGEVSELRRKDVDTTRRVLRVRRGVVHVPGHGHIVGEPKTQAGIRDVTIPPHLMPAVTAHLATHTGIGPESLLFTSSSGGHVKDSTARRGWFHHARTAADRQDLTFHGLRHTGATLAAATGATLAELMHRLGHTTPAAAMIYQHAAADRDRVIADALSKLATDATVTPIRPDVETAAHPGSPLPMPPG